jgi:hypothetical protein
VISRIRELPAWQQRQLIKLLHAVMQSPVDLDEVDDEQLQPLLVATLRRALEVPDKDDADLPEYLRRRLVDLVRRQFELIADADMLTDMELARVLVDFTLESAEQLRQWGRDDDRRKDFETFLRTKSRDERLAWLKASQRFSALIQDEPFEPVTTKKRTILLLDENMAAQEITKMLLADLDRGRWARWKSTETDASSTVSERGSRSAEDVKDADDAASAAAAGAAARVAAGVAAGSALVGPALGLPLGAVAGGLFMAGLRRRELVRASDTENIRKLRARRSKLVQSVVALSAFMVANATTDGDPPARPQGGTARLPSEADLRS